MAVKNSVPAFYQHLVASELFADMLRVADPMKRVGRGPGKSASAVL